MFRVSCIQLKSNNNILDNLKRTEQLISKAVKQKSDFILTPEISSLFSIEKKELLKICNSMEEDTYLNGIKKSEISFFTDKSKQRERWDLAGVSGPSWITAQTYEEAKYKICDLNYPLIIKPVDSAGSRGITKLDDIHFF